MASTVRKASWKRRFQRWVKLLICGWIGLILLSIPASSDFIERFWNICGFTAQKKNIKITEFAGGWALDRAEFAGDWAWGRAEFAESWDWDTRFSSFTTP